MKMPTRFPRSFRWAKIPGGTGALALLATTFAGCWLTAAAAAETSNVEVQKPVAVQRDKTAGGVKPSPNDTLVLAYAQDPDTLNAITSSDTVSESFQRRVYDALADQDFHDPDKFVPGLAESWEFDKDKLEFTIHLRKGVKWHPMKLPNGKELPETEFTAKDVTFSWACVLNKHVEAPHTRSYYEDPEATNEADRIKVKVTAVDKYTVKIRWKKPYFLVREFTLGGFPIIPRHVYSVDRNGEPISFDFTSKEFADGFNNHWANKLMCGTGPMMLKSWDLSQRLTVERNPQYWGEPFYFTRLVERCVSNPNTMAQMLLQNEIDFAGIPDKDRYVQARENENVKAGKVKLVDFAYPGYRYVGYNLRRDLFKDKRFRWALSHAVPVDKIIKEVFKEMAQVTTGPFMPGASAYDSSIPPVAYDLAQARKLLEEAGWTDTDGDGVRDKEIGGRRVPARFELMIYSEAPSYRTIAEIIKEECRKIGVDVNVAPAQWSLMLQKLRKQEFDAAMLGWATPWKQDPFQIWHSSQADLPDSSNHIGYRNPEVDKLIETLRVTLDPEKQKELYHQIHRKIYDDQPYTFLFSDRQTGGHHARLENIQFYKIRPCVDNREWYSNKPREMGP